MRDRELDDILKRAAQAQPDPDPALLEKIAGSIGSDLRPVRPLPPAWVLTLGLVLICLAVAVAGAARLGFHGTRAMDAVQHLIFLPLGLLIAAAATAWTGEMIPGSRRFAAPAALLAVTSAVLVVLFAVLFRDSHTDRFVFQGLACLSAGLLHAVPVALAGWWLVRRGFAVNPVAAGLAAGTLAGLAGVTMLELHCPNFQTWHVLVWHTALIPLSAGAGALLASWRSSHARN